MGKLFHLTVLYNIYNIIIQYKTVKVMLQSKDWSGHSQCHHHRQ